MREGTYVSDCRNKLIAKIFKEIEWIERYGTGIHRIRGYFEEYGSPEPLFENFQHGFRVTAFPLLEDDFTESAEKSVDKIIQFIDANPKITQKELSQLTGLSRRGIEKITIKDTEKDTEKISVIQKGRQTFFYLTNNYNKLY